MTKRTIGVCLAVALSLVAGAETVLAERSGMGMTPDAEFVTLSDMVSASAPITATAAPATPVPELTLVAPPSADGPALTAVSVSVTGTAMTAEAPAPASVPALVTATTSTTAAGVETVTVQGFTSVSERQNLISVSLDDVPLQDVVRLFTRISGANIISSSTNMGAKVTVNLQDVEWKPALDSILDMYNLTVTEKVPGTGIYSVMAKVPGQEPVRARTIFLNYAAVSNVVAVITPMLGKDGSISPYQNANAIVVRASAANQEDIQKVIEALDKPRQQVYIEVKILELTDKATKDLGIDWTSLQNLTIKAPISQTLIDNRSTFNGNRTGLGTVDSNLRPLGASAAGAPGSGQTDSRTINSTVSDGSANGPVATAGNTIDQRVNYQHEQEHIKGQFLSDIRTATLSAPDLQLVLSALQTVSGARVVSNPKLIVANGKTATIHIGADQPNIKGTTTPGQQGQANTKTYALDDRLPYIKTGITLEVTPTINSQSNVVVSIVPTLSDVNGYELRGIDGDRFPIIGIKTLDTLFSLESGRTAVIGGLTKATEKDNVTKIPLLGDIPLLGKYLFSHTSKEHGQEETIILVTVGLANSETVQREEGLPEDGDLARKYLAERELARSTLTKAKTKPTPPPAPKPASPVATP